MSGPGKLRQGRRRRMTKFGMDEISAVDFPAQEGARALLLKRKGQPGYVPGKKGRLEPDGLRKAGSLVVLTSAEEDHAHGLRLFPGDSGGSTWLAWDPSDEHSHDHAWVLKADGSIEIGVNAGHGHTVAPSAIADAFMLMTAAAMTEELFEMGKRLTKRDFSASARERLAAEGKALPDGSFPIADVEDLKTAIRAAARAPDRDAAAKHIQSRARALGHTGLLPAQLALKTRKEGDMPEKTPEQVEELERKLARAEKLAELTDAQKEHRKGLDEQGQAAFLELSAEDRQKAVDAEARKRADADPVVYTDLDGNEYRKSDDGRVVAAIKRADEATKRAVAAETARSNDAFEKRADAELGNLPGTPKERAALLKAIDGIEDEDARKKALEAVHAGDKAMKAALATRGHEHTNQAMADAGAELEKIARDLMTKDSKLDYLAAYEKAGETNPELLKRAIQGDDN